MKFRYELGTLGRFRVIAAVDIVVPHQTGYLRAVAPDAVDDSSISPEIDPRAGAPTPPPASPRSSARRWSPGAAA